MYQKLDVTNFEDFIEAEKSFSQYTNGTCDIFFNNAGIANFAGAFEDIKIEEMSKIIDVNFKGVVNGCFVMLNLLKNTKDSMLLNTSSVAGLITAPGISVYGATKHAVSSLTENLRIEFERYGIKVSEINPWFTETPILDAEPVTSGVKSQLDREFVKQKTKVYPVEKVVSSVWSAYGSNKIHNPVGFEAKFSSLFMKLIPPLIRNLSKKLFKDSFI
jgi:Short-chain dehydrogenases of various substrate specificities